jgi:hypothetical protein
VKTVGRVRRRAVLPDEAERSVLVFGVLQPN